MEWGAGVEFRRRPLSEKLLNADVGMPQGTPITGRCTPATPHLQQPREPGSQRGGLPAALEPRRGDARHEQRVQRLDEGPAQGDGAWAGRR